MSPTQAHLCPFLFPCLWWVRPPKLEMPVFRKLFSIAVFFLSFVTFLSSRNLNRRAGTSRHTLHVYPLLLHTYSFIHFLVSWLYSLKRLDFTFPITNRTSHMSILLFPWMLFWQSFLISKSSVSSTVSFFMGAWFHFGVAIFSQMSLKIRMRIFYQLD